MQTYDIDILDYIRTGHDRAITRAELSDLTGIDDRTIRDMIHYARRDIPILNMQDGRGYFVPDMNIFRRENDADEVHQTRRKPAEEYRLGTKNSKANSQELQHGGRHR